VERFFRVLRVENFRRVLFLGLRFAKRENIKTFWHFFFRNPSELTDRELAKIIASKDEIRDLLTAASRYFLEDVVREHDFRRRLRELERLPTRELRIRLARLETEEFTELLEAWNSWEVEANGSKRRFEKRALTAVLTSRGDRPQSY